MIIKLRFFRPTFGDEWCIEGDRLDAYRDHLGRGAKFTHSFFK